MRQEGILLCLVEAMHLIQEQHRRAPLGRGLLRLGHGIANVLDAGLHRRQRDELRLRARGDQPRERGLAGAGRAPQDQRVRLSGRDGLVERLARGEQMRLPDELLERARAHAIGEGLPVAVASEAQRALHGGATSHGVTAPACR